MKLLIHKPLWTIPALLIALSGCMGKQMEDDTSYSNSNLNSALDGGIPIANPPMSTPSSVMISTFDVLLSRMNSATQTTPSATTNALYQLNLSTFPVNGTADEINAGMWMAIASLGGSVCEDLYNKERAQAAGSRIFYSDFNLATGAMNNFNAMVGNISVKRKLMEKFALSFFGRPASAIEIGHFETALTDLAINQSSANLADTHDALLTLCAGALGSLASFSTR
jgi:hypothetical protein